MCDSTVLSDSVRLSGLVGLHVAYLEDMNFVPKTFGNPVWLDVGKLVTWH